jgi:glycerol-3-phosphate dehydrogenase
METDYDLLIIGGGINGTGVARDAAGRGMRVLLVEAGDLAGATSSASTKLIHGGLRYLEYFEFRLVREALQEREVLLSLAPHIIWPMDFILPHVSKVRPAWMIRAGLWLYDHLGKREKLKGSAKIDLSNGSLKKEYKTGFRYADCWVEDSRLVVLNALDAKELGAHIVTRTACTDLRVENGHWRATLRDVLSGQTHDIAAAMVVNAAGPWVRTILDDNQLAREKKTPNIRLVKGSHIIVPRLYEGDHAYILQQKDKRIVFAIPYEGRFTLIGTTDTDYKGDPAKAVLDDVERDYLINAIQLYFDRTISLSDIVHHYSGVRPLMDDGKGRAESVTRDYHLDVDLDHGAPMISVFGGKITTYRRLATEVVCHLIPHWARRDENPASLTSWTDTVPLPGGDMLYGDFEEFIKDQEKAYPWLPAPLLRRYARAYGTRMDRFLQGATDTASLGRSFGDGIYQAEIDYLIRHEWAKTSDDILWRRSKLGLHISKETQQALDAYIKAL